MLLGYEGQLSFFLDEEEFRLLLLASDLVHCHHHFCRHDVFAFELFHDCADSEFIWSNLSLKKKLKFFFSNFEENKNLLFDNLLLAEAGFLGFEFFEQFTGRNGLYR